MGFSKFSPILRRGKKLGENASNAAFLLRTIFFKSSFESLHPRAPILVNRSNVDPKKSSYNPVNPWKPCSVETAKRLDRKDRKNEAKLSASHLFYRFESLRLFPL